MSWVALASLESTPEHNALADFHFKEIFCFHQSRFMFNNNNVFKINMQ